METLTRSLSLSKDKKTDKYAAKRKKTTKILRSISELPDRIKFKTKSSDSFTIHTLIFLNQKLTYL